MERRVEIKVRMQCECRGCDKKVEKMKKSVKGMAGVGHVQVEREEHGDWKLTVIAIGAVNPDDVLKRVRRLTPNKLAELLPVPQVTDDVVPQPTQPEPVNIHNVLPHDDYVQEPSMLPPPPSFLDDMPNYTTTFSDDNPNSCTVM